MILAAVQSRGQQYFFRNYSVESGLPFVQVSCMHQDSDGYLWSGGYGGLSRFDGKVFLNYNKRNGLIDHNVNAICTDAAGAVFIGTSKGMSVLSNRKFTNYAEFGSYKAPVITSLCRGYHHAMYIGSSKGLFMYSNGNVKPVRRFEGFQVNFLYKPDTSLLYVGTDHGLVIYGHKTWKVIDRRNGLPSDNVNTIERFRNFIAIGTSAGLSLLDLKTGSLTNYNASHGLIDEQILCLKSQDDQSLWVGSQGGLLRFDGERFEYFSVAGGNNANHIRCIVKDREDNIWFGTHSGLYRYRDKSFCTFETEGLGSAFTFMIFRDREKSLWITTQNNGVYRVRENSITRFGPADGITNNTCRSGLEDQNGRLWFGTEKGLTTFEKNRFIPVAVPGLLGPVDYLFLSKKGTLWVGGSNGFASVETKKGKRETRFYPIKTRPDFQVFGFCEDDSGAVYVGTYKAGLFRLWRDSLVNISQRYHMSEENFFVLKYREGKIFAASLNGVLVWEIAGKKLERITDADGLNSDLVYSLEFTRDGKSMWIGTNQGINRLALRDYLSGKQIRIQSFGRQEGFTGVECNDGIWEDEDGSVWFGTVSGVVRHQPWEFRRNTVEPKTNIQNILLMNEDTLLTDSVDLPSDHNTISFYFRGICLTNPEKVLYQRRLDGLNVDKDWSAPTAENFIKYTNLAPGRYTFRVRACNNEGVWNRGETRYTFSIRSPFYLTWWFILLAIIFSFTIVYAIFIYRIFTLKRKQKLELDRRIEMSKIELKALRSQMNPHFVFNSLNAIQHYIFNTKSDEAIKYLNKFARLVRLILNNSDKQTVTVGEDIEALKLYLELEQMRFEGKFDYEIIIDKTVDPDYDIMPPLLMQPYVENAILHGLNPKPEKGMLTIRVHSENNFLICTITDNGIGRRGSSEIRRTMPSSKHKPMGMKITEDRLRILNEINNSQLSVTVTDLIDKDGKPAGTQVQLFVPLTG